MFQSLISIAQAAAQNAAPAAAAAANTAANAAAPAAKAPGTMENLMGLIPMVVIILAMFYLMYRNQKKEQKRRAEMINSVQAGVPVVTIGGIKGSVVAVKEDCFTVKIADNVKIDVTKSAIASVEAVAKADNGEVAKK